MTKEDWGSMRCGNCRFWEPSRWNNDMMCSRIIDSTQAEKSDIAKIENGDYATSPTEFVTKEGFGCLLFEVK